MEEQEIKGVEESAQIAPPDLSSDVDDKNLVNYIRAYIKKSDAYYKDEIKLYKKRKLNERFYFGHQMDWENRTYKGLTSERVLKSYEKPYSDNVIKEGEDMLRPMLLSRLPDLLVKPGTDGSDQSQQSAEAISKVVNNAITDREIKKVLTTVSRHHPVYYVGIIKYRWDPNKGKNGDIVFEAIHPNNVLVDHTATENNERAMRIIVHFIEKSLKDWIRMFPDKEDDLIAFARKKGKFTGDLDEKALAVDLKISEVWYDWFNKAEEEDNEELEETPEPKYKTESGVCWLVDDTLLDVRKNPNWDWDGEDKIFFNGQPVPDELLPQLAMIGMQAPGITTEKVYRNFFGKPRKPFIFMGYEQWGRQPYDETTRVEENILLQENYDTRGMQITKMIDDSRGKHAFSSLSGLKRDTVEQMDLDDPDQDLFIDGDLTKVHSFISKEQPSVQMFNDLTRTRERMLAKVHVNAPTRGEIASDTATTNQIAREADFTVADDIANDTINDMAIQMAEATLHMMKLRYTEEHFKAVLGSAGVDTFERFTNDMIEDGMEVKITASGTDKLKAERQAKDEASLGLIDPLTYYKDTGRTDPEDRAEKLFLFQTNPELYYKKFVMGEDVPDIAEQIMMFNQQRLQQVQGTTPQGGQNMIPGTRMQPSPTDTTQIATQPQGGQNNPNLLQRAGSAIKGMFGG